MKIILLVGLLFIVVLLFSCKAKEKYTPETFEKEMIVFGNSGGFAGHTTTYSLLSNGQFFYKAPRKSDYSAIAETKKNATKQIFNNLTVLGISELELNDPGNLTYFLEIHKEGLVKKLQWGGTNEKVPETLKIYFVNLMQLAKKQNDFKAESKTEKS